ncbi:response regulator transcription factor [Kaistella flava (ex Peng et al. 2021)]|uniref:Response regulator transcription factor n=1 Tax=Kaistella flava (ex Peng et al. 2021) TaxID=2038776 RepID=A0A7M2Y6Z1_9FLAO|nr:response regulator transcription factor [Kaistella flava (ex Peng et al. 2021)]QOW09434.1 response regulator transcription factor [Kaistella flava (ex Peng et al. 2021)]
MQRIKIAIVDDHKLVSKAIENMISFNPKFEVVMNCCNGEDFLKQLEHRKIFPEVVLMDINMPRKNGIETTLVLSKNYPDLKVIALTMEDNESTIISMLKSGAKGYLLKDMSPDILFDAINIVHEKGIFYTDIVTQSLLKIKTEEKVNQEINNSLKDREIEFIKLACSELTYKEIAEQMYVSPRTVDGYRDSIFAKLNVKTRVGIVLFAIKHEMC